MRAMNMVNANCWRFIRMDRVYSKKPPNETFTEHFGSLDNFRKQCSGELPHSEFLFELSSELTSRAETWNRILASEENKEVEEADCEVDAMFENGHGGQTKVLSKRSRGKRKMRGFWNSGTGFHEIRRPKKSRVGIDNVHNSSTSSGRRCIVCCELCMSGIDHSYRKGYKTTKGCTRCTIDCTALMRARSDTETLESEDNDNALALCTKTREHRVMDKENGGEKVVTMSCWALHHSNMLYPVYKCTKDELPIEVPKPVLIETQRTPRNRRQSAE